MTGPELLKFRVKTSTRLDTGDHSPNEALKALGRIRFDRILQLTRLPVRFRLTPRLPRKVLRVRLSRRR